MPNKDGFEVLTEMRANVNVAHIPVIIITAARIGIKDVREGLTLGRTITSPNRSIGASCRLAFAPSCA